MVRFFFLGAGVLGAVLSGSGTRDVAQEASASSWAPAAVASAPPLAAAATVRLDTVASGLSSITAITVAGDERLFLTLQSGTIRIWNGIEILPTPFLDLSAKISCCGERGLLSTAFHPSYSSNGLFFVDYTNTNGDTVIERYRVSSNDPNQADPSSAAILLTIGQPFANHNGGQLQFGPDGFLYIGMGDGGSANDPNCNAQSNASLLGKLLRIDVDQSSGAPPFHGIPPTNPFLSSGGPDEAWAKGLRNPWRFSFDRATGDLLIGDVGQDAREEIDFQPVGSPGGENYGWKVMEGFLCGTGGDSGCTSPVPPCHDPAYTLPVLDYTHEGGNCTVIGGYVYRGLAVPDLYGMYVYGDYCSGRIWATTPGQWSPQLLSVSLPNLQTFGEDVFGELYAGTGDGTLYRFAATVTLPPSIAAISPSSGSERGGDKVTISGTNFTAFTLVFFGSSPAAAVVTSPTSLNAFPPRGSGTVDVTVVNPGLPPATLPGAFSYLPIVRVETTHPRPRVVIRPAS